MRRKVLSSCKWWLRYKQKEAGDLFFKTPMFVADCALAVGWAG